MSGFKKAASMGQSVSTRTLTPVRAAEAKVQELSQSLSQLPPTQELEEDEAIFTDTDTEDSFDDEPNEAIFREEARAWLTEFGPKLYSIEYSRHKVADEKKSLSKTLQKKPLEPPKKRTRRS